MLSTFTKLPESKQTRIFMAAFKVFAQKGFYKANVADICQEAEISNGALYKYFANKESLFISCIEYGIELMAKELFSKGISDSAPFFENVRTLLESAAEFSQNYSHVVALYLDLGSISHNKFARQLSQKVENRARNFHVNLVKEAIASGQIDQTVDPDIAAYIIDNNLMILAFSIISEHYHLRFQAYFGSQSPKLDIDKKIDIIMKSIRQLLKG
jgi:TetR/AcrR family transcriptional regulator